MNKRPSPAHRLPIGVIMVQARRALQSVDLPPTWAGPAGTAE